MMVCVDQLILMAIIRLVKLIQAPKDARKENLIHSLTKVHIGHGFVTVMQEETMTVAGQIKLHAGLITT